MRIGLLTDIHEAVEHAAAAIRELRRREVDEIICLGDFCALETRLTEMCNLLFREKVRTVWGNHDFGLCEDVIAGNATGYPRVVQEFARTVKPKIQVDSCLFCHVEPWLDTSKLEDLWYYEGKPDTNEQRARIFANTGWDVAFAGHYHDWLAYSATGSLEWNGQSELDLSRERHFVVIDACMNGQFALFDTQSRVLTPLHCT